MASKKPDPFTIDEDTKPLTNEEIATLRSGEEILARTVATIPRGRPPLEEGKRKIRVTMMLDRDVVDHFKQKGRGWQTRANQALRKSAKL